MESDQVTAATILRNQPHDPGGHPCVGDSSSRVCYYSAPALHNNLARLAQLILILRLTFFSIFFIESLKLYCECGAYRQCRFILGSLQETMTQAQFKANGNPLFQPAGTTPRYLGTFGDVGVALSVQNTRFLKAETTFWHLTQQLQDGLIWRSKPPNRS